jgi:hypothetical protein
MGTSTEPGLGAITVGAKQLKSLWEPLAHQPSVHTPNATASKFALMSLSATGDVIDLQKFRRRFLTTNTGPSVMCDDHLPNCPLETPEVMTIVEADLLPVRLLPTSVLGRILNPMVEVVGFSRLANLFSVLWSVMGHVPVLT